MFRKPQVIYSTCGIPYEKYTILSDVNVPYKFCFDTFRNSLYFCINSDDFSDQSFQSVVLDLDTGLASIIPSIRNGFTSAVDASTGNVYLGGSQGIFLYDHTTRDIIKTPLLYGVDIFDMFFKNRLYFVDTYAQDVHYYENGKSFPVPDLQDQSIHHFIIDGNNDWFYVNPSGLYTLPHGERHPILYGNSDKNFRGAALDTNGVPYFIAHDGIYVISKESKQLSKIISIVDGYGLSFDRYNNIIYSDERTVNKLVPC